MNDNLLMYVNGACTMRYINLIVPEDYHNNIIVMYANKD